MSDKIIATTKYLELVDRDGWTFARRPHSHRVVCVIAVSKKDEILLVEQHRPPLGCSVIELPAGLAGDLAENKDETLMQAAKRELLEETGFSSSQWRLLGHTSSSAGLTDEVVAIFHAAAATKESDGGGTMSEQITVHRIPLRQADEWLTEARRRGAAIDGRVFAALYLVNRVPQYTLDENRSDQSGP